MLGTQSCRGARVNRTRPIRSIIEPEGDGYVAPCPELDIASQGTSSEEAWRDLRETLELFLEFAEPAEIRARMREE